MSTDTIQQNSAITVEPELDPLSDRYRVCPNCGSPHMVRNKGRDFCSDRCADQHYNARRRLMKQAEPKRDIEPAPLPLALPALPPVPEPIAVIESVAVTTEEVGLPTQPQVTDYEKNIQILESSSILPDSGTVYHLDDLTRAGFVYDACSGRGTLHNIDPKLNCHFVQYGKYRIYRVDFSHVLIHKNQQLKTKTDD